MVSLTIRKSLSDAIIVTSIPELSRKMSTHEDCQRENYVAALRAVTFSFYLVGRRPFENSMDFHQRLVEGLTKCKIPPAFIQPVPIRGFLSRRDEVWDRFRTDWDFCCAVQETPMIVNGLGG
jgi:hypothetical protein